MNGGRVAVIIGSGFGGSVTALRLMQHHEALNLKVILLERGRRYGPNDFPRVKVPEAWTQDPDLQTSKRLPDLTRVSWKTDQGLWDLRNLGNLQVAQAAGYGGGSLVYASVHLRPPPEVFDKWARHPADTKKAGWYELLQPYYERVARELALDTAPDKWAKTAAFEATVGKLQRKAFRPPLAITFDSPKSERASKPTCTGCGNCINGCSVGAKNTLDKNYLHEAEKLGLEVRTLAEVTGITRQGTRRYQVEYLNHFHGGALKKEDADFVFLCAGALNSTEILLRSREHLGAPLTQLGEPFWANGDTVGVVFDTEPSWDATSGPTITTCVYHREPPAERPPTVRDSEPATPAEDPTWFLIQDGGIPPSLRRLIGIFRSPLWLGRNAYGSSAERKQARSPHSPRVSKGELDAFVAQLPNLFQARARFRPDAAVGADDANDLWKQILPKSLKGLLGGAFKPESTIRKELSYLNETILAELGTALAGGTLVRLLTPIFRGFIDLDMLTTITLRAVKRRLGQFGPLVDADSFGQLLMQVALSVLVGADPGSGLGILLGMGPDEAWTLLLKNERLRVAQKARPARQNMFARYGLQERLMRDIAAASGGRLYTNPRWTLGQTPITVHSQGGCCMPTVDAPGVAEPTGELQGLAGLFVLDGALLPSSVGVNPSHTIAAVAELNIAHFITRELSGDRRAIATEEPDTKRDLPEDDSDGTTLAIKKQPIAVSWTEWMDGFVSDPSKREPSTLGERQLAESCFRVGLREGQGLRLKLDAQVPSVDAMLITEEPVIEIEGTAWFSTPGTAQPVEYRAKGELRLPFTGATGKMIYNLTLTPREGELPLELTGTKYLKDDPGLDAWVDLTTLYVQIEGDGTIRRGVVHLHMDDFLLRQLPSFQAAPTGNEDVTNVGQAWALFRFAEFFFRKIRHIYDPGLA